MCSRPRGVGSCGHAPAACCVRSAASSRSASCGDKVLGTVRGTAPAARSRDRLEPPCRRVDRSRGIGMTCTGVPPRATRYAYKPDTNDGRLAIVRADGPDSRPVSTHRVYRLIGEVAGCGLGLGTASKLGALPVRAGARGGRAPMLYSSQVQQRARITADHGGPLGTAERSLTLACAAVHGQVPVSGGQGVAGSNPAVPTVFRTLLRHVQQQYSSTRGRLLKSACGL